MKDVYKAPAIIAVTLQQQSQILAGSSDPFQAGSQDYIVQPDLFW